jgi:hypothetical protein
MKNSSAAPLSSSCGPPAAGRPAGHSKSPDLRCEPCKYCRGPSRAMPAPSLWKPDSESIRESGGPAVGRLGFHRLARRGFITSASSVPGHCHEPRQTLESPWARLTGPGRAVLPGRDLPWPPHPPARADPRRAWSSGTIRVTGKLAPVARAPHGWPPLRAPPSLGLGCETTSEPTTPAPRPKGGSAPSRPPPPPGQ